MRDWRKLRQTTSANGYRKIYAPWHPLADRSGQCYVHRLVVYDRGVRIRRGKNGTHCHHKRPGNKSDNRPSNLEALPARSHNRLSAIWRWK